MIIVITSAVVG